MESEERDVSFLLLEGGREQLKCSSADVAGTWGGVHATQDIKIFFYISYSLLGEAATAALSTSNDAVTYYYASVSTTF